MKDKKIIIGGYTIDKDFDIVGCSYNDYFKSENQRYKDIIKKLLKR